MKRFTQALRLLLALAVVAILASVARLLWNRFAQTDGVSPPSETPSHPFDAAFIRLSPLEIAALPEAVRFDYPMGSQNAALTYNAQPFRITRHLGDDLNGIGGENSDLGDPVFAAGAGKIAYSGVPGPGWGNMLILAHRVPETGAPGGFAVYQTVYAHLEKILVRPDQVVQRGDQLGTVGTANGQYLAHLHFEVRMGPYVNPSVGYADAPLNRMSPEKFINEHRGAPDDQLNPAPHLDSSSSQ